jgi:hypothetical protein
MVDRSSQAREDDHGNTAIELIPRILMVMASH